MDRFENDDVVELGEIATETRGVLEIGIPDTEPNCFVAGGIDCDN